MNFLIRPDAEQLLAADNYRRLLGFLAKGTPGDAGPAWLTEALKSQYREVWSKGLRGGCNYYRASPLRPARPDDPGAVAIELPVSMLSIGVPTLVLWGLDDVALLPALLDGLEVYVADLTLRRVVGASHWIVHERGELVARELAEFIAR
jgi:pimeloyl-ACP methyl ester carboxylesterase